MTNAAGWKAAGRVFPVLGACAECEDRPARYRHHWDGNPRNNVRNIVPLCHWCHARVHGWMEGLHDRKRARTHCYHGHEYTPENTYTDPRRGTRECRECRREAQRRWKARHA